MNSNSVHQLAFIAGFKLLAEHVLMNNEAYYPGLEGVIAGVGVGVFAVGC